MTRIVEHRSALPNGTIVAVHIRRDASATPAVFAQVAVEVFGRSPAPAAFPERAPVDDGFLEALTFAERESIAVVWIDDPLGLFPLDKRPVREIGGK